MAKYILSDIELEEALSEIVTGKKIFHYNGEIMGMKYPTSRDRDNSRTIYVMKYKELENKGLPKKEDLKVFFLKTGALDQDFYSRKLKIEKDLERLYYARKKTGSSIQLARIDADIEMVTNTLVNMEIIEDDLMVNSLEYNAEAYRINYLISTSKTFLRVVSHSPMLNRKKPMWLKGFCEKNFSASIISYNFPSR